MTERERKLERQNKRLTAELQALVEALRLGPPEVIGYDANGLRNEGFRFGWNQNANRLWDATTRARHVIRQVSA